MNLHSVGRSIGLLLVGLTFSSVNASDPDAVKQASALVGQAIQAEIDGDLVGRDRMLKEATQIDATFAPAHWLQGQVFLNGKWTSIEDSVREAKSNRALAEYESMRAMQPASVQGNWQAAQWCAKNGMARQCRAHLENILMLDHDNQAARKALGHQLVGNDWLTPADQVRMMQRAEFVRLSKEKYGERIEGLVKKAVNGNTYQKEQALKDLSEVDDSLAIPSLESVAELGSPAAMLTVSLLTKLKHPESAKSLMRIAVLYPDVQVKNSAIEGLKKKQLHDFVPEMLAAMSSPIFSLTTPIFEGSGKVTGFRQFFAREGMEDYRSFDFDTRVSIQLLSLNLAPFAEVKSKVHLSNDPSKPYGQQNEWAATIDLLNWSYSDEDQFQAAMLAAITTMAAQASIVEKQNQVEKENRQIAVINRVIADVLSELTNVEFVELPRDVWNWWDKHNETSYQQTKYHRHMYDQARYSSTYEAPTQKVPYDTAVVVWRASCFVAGTKINTLKGLMEIEKIMPGDQVLSRDIQTGALGYKPVVCRTNRDPAKTVILKVDDDTIHATTSHLLWVCGKGWVKAGQIKVGDLLHTAAEPAVVLSTTPGAELPTHNLIVADTHNYFVGSSRVLSHDVLPRASVYEKVPGQSLFTASSK